MLNLLLIK